MKRTMMGTLMVIGLPGCVTYTKTDGEEATVKRFQNAEAARIFYEAEFVREEKVNDSNDKTISLSLGLTSPISWGCRVTDQKRVNDAFLAADRNKNGTLSLSEAHNFALLKRGDSPGSLRPNQG